MFIRNILQDLFKLKKLIDNTENGKKLQFSEKKSTKLNQLHQTK